MGHAGVTSPARRAGTPSTVTAATTRHGGGVDGAKEPREREGDEHVEAGRVTRFESTDEFVDYLDSIADGRE